MRLVTFCLVSDHFHLFIRTEPKLRHTCVAMATPSKYPVPCFKVRFLHWSKAKSICLLETSGRVGRAETFATAKSTRSSSAAIQSQVCVSCASHIGQIFTNYFRFGQNATLLFDATTRRMDPLSIRTINSSYYLNCTTCWIKLTHSFD